MWLKNFGIFTMNIACIFLFFAMPVFGAETIVIKGSTTILPIVKAAAEAYMTHHPETNISISAEGSGHGIKAMLDKTTDIAISSRELKQEELDSARGKGIQPVRNRIAIDAIVPIVYPANPITNLTMEQLNFIYQGRITNWKEVGGYNKRIIVISRDTNSGTFDTWEEKIMHKAKVTPRAQLQASNETVIQSVSKNKYAIGYVGIGFLDKTVKSIKVSGVEASVHTALSGEYPISRPLFVITNGEPVGLAGDFIRYLLGNEGQRIVKKEGFVPLR